MRAREFINEQKLSDVHDGLEVAAKALPYTYVIPELENQDFYNLYRFGVAIADVRGTSIDDTTNNYKPKFHSETLWNEKQIVSSFDPTIGQVIDKALQKINKKGKQIVSTPGSDEMNDTAIQSTLKPFKGYKK